MRHVPIGIQDRGSAQQLDKPKERCIPDCNLEWSSCQNSTHSKHEIQRYLQYSYFILYVLSGKNVTVKNQNQKMQQIILSLLINIPFWHCQYSVITADNQKQWVCGLCPSIILITTKQNISGTASVSFFTSGRKTIILFLIYFISARGPCSTSVIECHSAILKCSESHTYFWLKTIGSKHALTCVESHSDLLLLISEL
jgi:hypothetical protein